MKLVFVLFYTTCYITLIISKRDYEWRFENITCSAPSEQSIVSALSCGLSKNLKRRSITLEVQFDQEITQFSINYKLILPRKPKDFVVLNLTNLDGCQYMGGKNQITLMQVIRKSAQRYSNVPLSCPFKKDTLYYLRGFRFDLEMLPAFSFETDVSMWYEIFIQNKMAFKGYLKSHIGLKNTKNSKH